MNYVYKIVGNFNDDNFAKIITKISPKFICTYTDKTLFIALRNIQELNGSEELINKTFRPVRDFYVEAINEQNINNLGPAVKDWCLDNLVRLDTERYETENQAKLKEVWLSMDKMEAELQQQLEGKEERKEV